MANLAIKGHATRGEEVIEILEMLGGKNVYQYEGCNACSCLFIDEVTNAIHSELLATIYYKRNVKHHILTLEEFLEKFPYKVGDRVRIPEYESDVRIWKMRWSNFGYVEYLVYRCDDEEWYTAEELNEYNEPHKEEIMKETNKAIFEGNAQCCNIMNDIIKDNIEETEEGVYAFNEINCYHQDFGDKVRIRLGGDFEIKVEDNLTYIVRKKPQYPDTYEDCCSVLGMTYYYPDIRMVSREEFNLYSSFIQLIRCRNAYWKIAGKEMGLGKPWKQDYDDRCFIICNDSGYVHTGEYHGSGNHILAFPTAEMRDAFYENFKELIEACKELL